MYKIKLSPYAKIFYNEWLLDPTDVRYNMPVDQILHGNLDIHRLRDALKRYVAEHLLLNSHIQNIDDEPHWVVNDYVYEMEYFDELPDNAKLHSMVISNFDLHSGPLYRFLLIRIEENKYRLILVFHHLLIDGVSNDVGLIASLTSYYNSEQYQAKLSTHEQIKLNTDLTERLNADLEKNRVAYKEYWHKQLDEVEDIDLRFLKTEEFIAEYAQAKKWNSIGEINFSYSSNVLDKLNQIKRKFIITPYLYSQCIFAFVLYKYTGQKNLAISYPIAIKEGIDFIYGAQVNTNFIPFRFDSISTLAELIGYARTVFKSLKQNNINFSYYPITEIVREGNKKLLNLAFIQANFKSSTFQFNGIHQVEVSCEFKMDSVDQLLFEQEIRNNQINFRVRYDKRFINTELLNNFINCYQRLFTELEQDLLEGREDNALSNYNLLTDEQYRKVIYDFNLTYKEYPKNKTIHELFEEQVLKTPNNLAVAFGDIKLTYSELNEKANRLANYLLESYAIRLEDIIGIYLNNSEKTIITLLSILKTGAAYLPIDKDWSDERTKFVLKDIAPKVILTDSIYEKRLKKIIDHNLPDINILSIEDSNLNLLLDQQKTINPKVLTQPNNLIYVIYTSGTTGEPKGVLVEHKSVVNFVSYLINEFKLGSESVGCKYASIAFDASVTEIYPILLSGGSLCIIKDQDRLDPESVNNFFKTKGITFAFLPTKFAEFFFKLKNDSLKVLIVAGDKLDLFEKQRYRVINAYGPTEATVHTTSFDVTRSYQNIPIGRPINNVKCYVVDNDLHPLPIGAIGELVIGGDSLARGYFNRNDLTSAKFVTNVFEGANDASQNRKGFLYKTGDLVRWLPEGIMEFIGRNDSQVKINGFRVELGEVESKLLKYPSIQQAVALVKCHKIGDRQDKYIIAFYVADKKLSESKLINYLAKQLPEYMLPRVVIHLTKLPLTSNGKIDRRVLDSYSIYQVGRKQVVPPRNKRERLICNAFSKALGVKEIGINDDFFVLGGNSLQAISLVSLLRNHFDIKVSDVFNLRTPGKISQNAIYKNNVLRQKLEIVKLLYKNKESHSGLLNNDLKRKMAKYRKDIDNLQINCTLQKNINKILLTGSTGYLGCNILNKLLELTDYKVFVLVRAYSGEEAKERLNNKYKFYFDKSLDVFFDKRLFVVRSDIEKERLDLSKTEYEGLIQEIDSVIHAAALVKHFGDYNQFYSANVQATVNLLEFTQLTRLKDFHYISTYSVLNSSFVPGYYNYIATEDDMPINPEYLSNIYLQTKLEGEKKVIEYRAKGVSSNIYRVGNLALMAENYKLPEKVKDNAFYGWLQCLLKIRCIINEFSKVEISQADFVAEAIVKLFDKKQLDNKVYHVFNPFLFNLTGFLAYSKLSLEILTIDEFIDRILYYLDNNLYHEIIIKFLLRQGWLEGVSLKNITSINVLQNRTQHILKQLGFKWLPITRKGFMKCVERSEIIDAEDMAKKEKIFSDLEMITSVLPTPIYWMDKNGVMLGRNEHFRKAFVENIGVSSDFDTIGKNVYDVYPKELADEIARHDAEVLQSGKTISQIETVKHTKTKKIKYFNAVKAPLRDKQGKIIGIVGTSVDITAEKEAETLRNELHESQLKNELQKSQIKEAERIREITAQVSHDIRSPLTSLKVIISHLKNLDEDSRTVIRNATDRINDIVNNLVIKYGASGEVKDNRENVVNAELISCLIDNLLSEKRAQYIEQDIVFELDVADAAQGLFAKVDSVKFKRLLSNVINNAVEAINKARRKQGLVNISILQNNNFILIRVKDNGCGFPQELIDQIGVVQISTKQERGHGIGLSSAIPLIKTWGGNYRIETIPNEWTVFEISLPIAYFPKWFQKELSLVLHSNVIVLDDDESIHNVWNARFQECIDSITIKHFSNSSSFLARLFEFQSCSNTMYLIDYELIGSDYTGLDVIEKLPEKTNAFLVTSRYEDKKIKEVCEKLGVKIIPKNFAPYIPIKVVDQNQLVENKKEFNFMQPNYVFIDDDQMIVKTWEVAAEINHVKLLAFTGIRDFEKVKDKLDKKIPIYIDYQMCSINGMEYSKELAAEGFSNLYLATGYDKNFFDKPYPWLKDIVSKDPPFMDSKLK